MEVFLDAINLKSKERKKRKIAEPIYSKHLQIDVENAQVTDVASNSILFTCTIHYNVQCYL